MIDERDFISKSLDNVQVFLNCLILFLNHCEFLLQLHGPSTRFARIYGMQFLLCCCDVCAEEMNGVIVEVVDAKMALRISLSCLIQWVFYGLVVNESLGEGGGLSPVT